MSEIRPLTRNGEIFYPLTVAEAVSDPGGEYIGYYEEDSNYVRVILDDNKRLLAGIRADGSIEWARGIPNQIKEYVQGELSQIYDYARTVYEYSKSKFRTEDNENFIYQIKQDNGIPVFSIRSNGDIVFGHGIPEQIKECYGTYEESQNNDVFELSTKDGKTILNIDNTGSIPLSSPVLKRVVERLDFLNDKCNYAISKIKPELEEDYTINSFWTDKNIWWCGTSIPAGGYWNLHGSKTYPVRAGNILGATVYNEAVGSSSTMNLFGHSGNWESITRAMLNTVQENLALFNYCFNIDDSQHTASNKGVLQSNGTYTIENYDGQGHTIHSIPSINNSYVNGTYMRYYHTCNSYQIKLVAKYLLSNTTEHDEYLEEVLGSSYHQLVEVENRDYSYVDCDLFVFDHGHNDAPTQSDLDADAGTSDLSKFIGRMNYLIRLLLQYKPRARFMIVSDYTDYTSNLKTCECQEKIATYWNVPFIDMRKYVDFSRDKQVLTRGYWSTDGYWFDSGFEWSENDVEGTYETNLFLNNQILSQGTSLNDIKAAINPHQVEGIWYWEAQPLYIAMKDGLHMHNQNSLDAMNLYARVLANFINTI